MRSITRAMRRLALTSWEHYDPEVDEFEFTNLLSIPFTLLDVSGRSKKLRLLLSTAPPFHYKAGQFAKREHFRPGFLRRDEEGGVVIYAIPIARRGEPSWEGVDSPDNLGNIKLTLQHELLHASDVIDYSKDALSPPIPGPQDSGAHMAHASEEEISEWKKHARYYNRTHELRAYLPQLLSEVREAVKKHMKQSRNAGIAIDLALARSTLWRTTGHYWTSKSRNLLLKGLVTALEDEGIIKIE